MKEDGARTRRGLGGGGQRRVEGRPGVLVVNGGSGELLQSLAADGGGDPAREILKWDCEGVLCGPIEKEAFLVIADEGGVTRYNAAGLTVREALKKLDSRKLELIRDHIGGDGCGGHSRSGGSECSGRHH